MSMMASLLLETSGHYSEAQLVVLVLAVLVVAVALLSYFVVAPEYEKRLEKQYAVAYAVHLDRDVTSISTTSTITSTKRAATQRYLAQTRTTLTKHRSLGRWDIEAAPSDDERSMSNDDSHYSHSHSHSHTAAPPQSTNAALRQQLTAAQLALLARRRKSESDALKHANVHRAELLRRRVLLKKLEEEIKGAMQEHDASTASATITTGANDSLVLTPERLQLLQTHPADCAHELAVLAASSSGGCNTEQLQPALQLLHDVLALYLSTDHRDMHKLTVFCNALLQHDGLNHLRALERAADADVRRLATAIIEMAVPSIWH